MKCDSIEKFPILNSESDFQENDFESDYAEEMSKLLKSLEIWDEVDLIDNNHVIYDNWPDKCYRFLSDNNIKPDFFCQYDQIVKSATKNYQKQPHQKSKQFRQNKGGGGFKPLKGRT